MRGGALGHRRLGLDRLRGVVVHHAPI